MLLPISVKGSVLLCCKTEVWVCVASLEKEVFPFPGLGDSAQTLTLHTGLLSPSHTLSKHGNKAKKKAAKTLEIRRKLRSL